MSLTPCGYYCRAAELGSLLSLEHCQDLRHPLETLKSYGANVLKKEEEMLTKNLMMPIPGLGNLVLETPLKRGQKVSVSFWLTKGKLQSSYSIYHNYDPQDKDSAVTAGSVVEMRVLEKHSQLSFPF